jgi:hypothetical protein
MIQHSLPPAACEMLLDISPRLIGLKKSCCREHETLNAGIRRRHQGEDVSSMDVRYSTRLINSSHTTLHFFSKPFPEVNQHLPNMSLRSPTFLMGLANLFAIGGATYHLRSHHIYNLEEHEARMDELEGTLRGHIGLIEESLERLEGKQLTKGQKA